MRQIVAAILLTALAGFRSKPQGSDGNLTFHPPQNASGIRKLRYCSAGTKVALALTSRLGEISQVGDSIHSATLFPVASAIRWRFRRHVLEGTIDALKRPVGSQNHAEFSSIYKVVFANGTPSNFRKSLKIAGLANPPAGSNAMVSQLAAGASATQPRRSMWRRSREFRGITRERRFAG